MATMAPDFVYAIVKENAFDTKVNVALYPTTARIRLKMPDPNNEGELIEITEGNWQALGLSSYQWEAVKAYNQEDMQTFTPFITSVTKHWYKDLDFSDCYVEAENNEGTTEDDEAFTTTYQYVGLGNDNDDLAGIENLYVEEVRKNDIFQVREPKVKKNELIKEMLLGGKSKAENTNEDYKYYIYNGSAIPEEGLKKQYIINKVKLPNGEDSYTMNTRFFTYAFGILEDVHSEDAEYILRDMKELFKDVGIMVEELEDAKGGGDEENEGKVKPLTWPIVTTKKDENGKAIPYKPVVWDPIYNAQTSKVIIKSKTETTLGFDEGMEVVMPANGKIVQIPPKENSEAGEADFGDSVKIELTETEGKDVEGMYIYMSGFKLDEGISEGQTFNDGDKIGTTIDRDITIIMTDKKRKAIQNVDEYIVPEDWKEDTTDEIKDPGFQGDQLGNGGNGNTSATTGSFSEEFYWYLATLEGMPINSDPYFTSANGGVSPPYTEYGEIYITVAPGLYMLPENCQKFREKGWSDFNEYSTGSVFPKDIAIQIYKERMEEFKNFIETNTQGCSLSQRQMEALVLSAYQRGTGSTSTIWPILDAIKAGKTGNELYNIWVRSNNNGIRMRRYAEWYLFTYGKYINKDTSREVVFTSSTPFTDMLNGIQSGHMY